MRTAGKPGLQEDPQEKSAGSSAEISEHKNIAPKTVSRRLLGNKAGKYGIMRKKQERKYLQ